MSRTGRQLGSAALVVAVSGVAAIAGYGAEASSHSTRPQAAEIGVFSRPFAEPTINGTATDEDCIPHEHGDHPHEDGDNGVDCKPSAVTMAALPNGKIIYFNGIEGSENIETGIAAELGGVSANDQTRVLDLSRSRPRWTVPSPADGGANPDGHDNEPLVEALATTETYNDGALFCADTVFLHDGRLMAAGGTAYYNDPGMDGVPYGVAELEGLRSTRFYDPSSNRWTQGRDMAYGRWYPTLVTLGDGRVFVAGGVQKLLKPVYPSHPEDSGRNVVQTETFDPSTGRWTYNGESADRTLPLFPRLHLLPNGHVFYNSAGQVFNPMGQAYDQLLWNVAASYDPEEKTWTDLGIPGVGTASPGFRGSTFSIMLPLTYRDRYSTARFLSAGGVVGTTPGSYVANATSAITTVDTSNGNEMSTEATEPLNLARWYSTGVALPTGEVVIFNGADRDEVVGPGTGFPHNPAELFDPSTNTWRTIAASLQARTYHNTAALLPDGRVLVGGHAPITTLYGNHTTLPGGFSPNDGRDPSFEIFSPPYLFRGERPAITSAPDSLGYGDRMTITTSVRGSEIESVVLVRNTSITHLVDGDQRVVELRVTSRSGNRLTVATPPTGNVAPPGPYMLFVNARSPQGSVPSVAQQVFIHPR